MKWILSLSILFLATIAYSQKISVSLFNDLNLQTILVTPVTGDYTLITGKGEHVINPNQILYISRTGDSVTVRDMSANLGTWKRVSLVGSSENSSIRVKPIVPSVPAQVYDDNLGFYVDFNRVMTLNLVEIDKYIAGVVEAEAGPSAHIEFYKAQVLLARTYALGHMERHSGEGFNLCDGVHCQAYKGKSTKNPSILKATDETKGLVVVDSKNELIVGTFHANCGGQTANSGDVWLTSYNYLTSVNDNYCRNLPSSQWEMRIPLDDWKAFLESKGVDVENLPLTSFNFNPKSREYKYPIADKNIPLIDIRNHFNLRSAFFTVEVISNSVRLKGKGYGHGVGMCQDGAMHMARRGKSFEDIILYYFTGVNIVNFSQIDNILFDHDHRDDHDEEEDDFQ
jgi:stage II sporulation protein D